MPRRVRANDESSDGAGRSPAHSALATTRTSRSPSVTRSSSWKGATPGESPLSSHHPFFVPQTTPPSTCPCRSRHDRLATSETPKPSDRATTAISCTDTTTTKTPCSSASTETGSKAIASVLDFLVIVKSSPSNHPSSASGSGGTSKDCVRGEREKTLGRWQLRRQHSFKAGAWLSPAAVTRQARRLPRRRCSAWLLRGCSLQSHRDAQGVVQMSVSSLTTATSNLHM